MDDTTPERDQALRAQQRYVDTLNRIRNDRDLTDEARRRHAAEVWTATRKELDGLQAKERERLTKREQELERRLFGLAAGGLDASAAISARDAQDRASRLSRPDEAAALLARAERNGDQTLAKAVAHHALLQSREAMTRDVEHAWDGVVGAFLDARPHMETVVDELAQIERLGQRQVFGPFSLGAPSGVHPSDLNAAHGATPAAVSV